MTLFSGKKFLMTFFSHRPGFSDFTFLDCIKCRIQPFLHQKNNYFIKEFLDKTIFFTLFVLSRASDNTTSLNIGGTNAWAVPYLTFLGRPSPQSPLGVRPWGFLSSGALEICRL